MRDAAEERPPGRRGPFAAFAGTSLSIVVVVAAAILGHTQYRHGAAERWQAWRTGAVAEGVLGGEAGEEEWVRGVAPRRLVGEDVRETDGVHVASQNHIVADLAQGADGKVDSKAVSDLTKFLTSMYADGSKWMYAQIVAGSVKDYDAGTITQPGARYGHTMIALPNRVNQGGKEVRGASRVFVHGGVVQGGISRDTWKYEAGVFPVINGKLITGMRKHDSVATLCSAASSGCNAWAQLETLGDDQKPFSLDRAFHAGVVLYGKDRGVDAQGVAYDELGANIPTNGRVVVFGGVDTRGDVTNTIWSMPLKGEETTITTKAENGTSSKTTETHKWQCPSVSAADETGDARDAASCSIPEYQMINGTKVLVESGAVPKILTGAHGTITSGRMVPRMNCLWRIDAPAAPPPKGKKWHIVLNIVEFDLGLKPYGMNATFKQEENAFVVHDSNDTTLEPILEAAGAGLRCGKASSDTGFMSLSLKYTNDCPAEKGFRAHYSITSEDPCPRWKKICSIHGTCVGGVCCCQDGWTGSRCDKRQTRVPQDAEVALLTFDTVRKAVVATKCCVEIHRQTGEPCVSTPCPLGSVVVCESKEAASDCKPLQVGNIPTLKHNSDPRIGVPVTGVFPAKRKEHTMVAGYGESQSTVVNNYFVNQSETDPEIKFPTFLDPSTLLAQTVNVGGAAVEMNYVAHASLCTAKQFTQHGTSCRRDMYHNFTTYEKALSDLCCTYGRDLQKISDGTYGEDLPLTRIRDTQLILEEQTIQCRVPVANYYDTRSSDGIKVTGVGVANAVPGPFMSPLIVRATIDDLDLTTVDAWHRPNQTEACPFTLGFAGLVTDEINPYDTAGVVKQKIENKLEMEVEVTITGTVRNNRYEGGGCVGDYSFDNERSDACCVDKVRVEPLVGRTAAFPIPKSNEVRDARFPQTQCGDAPDTYMTDADVRTCEQSRGVCHHADDFKRKFYASTSYEACTRLGGQGANQIRVKFLRVKMCNTTSLRKKCDIPNLEFKFVDDVRCRTSLAPNFAGRGSVSELVKGVDPYYVVLREVPNVHSLGDGSKHMAVETFTLDRKLRPYSTKHPKTYGRTDKYVEEYTIRRDYVDVESAVHVNTTEKYRTERVVGQTRGNTVAVVFGGWSEDSQNLGGFNDLWAYRYNEQTGDHWYATSQQWINTEDASKFWSSLESHTAPGRGGGAGCYPTIVVDESLGKVDSMPCVNLDTRHHPQFPVLNTANRWHRLGLKAGAKTGVDRPMERRGHTMVSLSEDIHATRMLMFGGAGREGYLNDLWMLNMYGLGGRKQAEAVYEGTFQCRTKEPLLQNNRMFSISVPVRLQCTCKGGVGGGKFIGAECPCEEKSIKVYALTNPNSTKLLSVSATVDDLRQALLAEFTDVLAVDISVDKKSSAPTYPQTAWSAPDESSLSLCYDSLSETSPTFKVRLTMYVHRDGGIRDLEAKPWQGAIDAAPWQEGDVWPDKVVRIANTINTTGELQSGWRMASNSSQLWPPQVKNEAERDAFEVASPEFKEIMLGDMTFIHPTEWVLLEKEGTVDLLPPAHARAFPRPRAHHASAMVRLTDGGLQSTSTLIGGGVLVGLVVVVL